MRGVYLRADKGREQEGRQKLEEKQHNPQLVRVLLLNSNSHNLLKKYLVKTVLVIQ